MNFRRHWIALVVAGVCCAGAEAFAQQDSGAASGSADSGSSGTGATSSFGSATSPFSSGSPSTSPFGSLFDTPAPSTSGTFGTNPTGTAPPAAGTPGASSAFGTGFGDAGQRRVQDTPTSFSIPGAYGQSAQTFTLGEGRLAKPRFEYSATVQLGYDDNVLQTPTGGTPAVTQEVLVDPGAPPETILVPQYETRIEIINGIPVEKQVFVGNVPVTKPGRDPVVKNEVLAPAQDAIGSFFTRTSLGAEITLASRRTVFTMDLRGNADFYFSRPNDNNDLTGSLAFSYLHQITPRMQFSATASLAYLSQPDVRIVSGPTTQVGDYFSGSFRSNLSYRWTRRFSTVASFSLNTLLYSVEAQKTGDHYEGLLGAEARYAWSRRLTLLGELRYGQVTYPTNQPLDSNTVYLLLGAEYVLSKRATASLRVGESVRTFANDENGGGASMAPYMEATLNWRLSKTGIVQWNSRLGFEEPFAVDTEVLGFRSGISFIQAFSTRLRGSAGVTYVKRNTTYDTSSANSSSTEQTIDFSVGLNYTISRNFSLNASYNYTQTLTDSGVTDYYRNRIFFGGEYTF